MKLYLTSLFTFLTFLLIGQSIKPKDIIVNAKKANSIYRTSPFTPSKLSERDNLPDVISNYNILKLNRNAIAELLKSDEALIVFSIPTADRKKMELELTEVSLGETIIRTSDSNKRYKYNPGRHYRGILKGDPNSVVALSVFQNEVMGIISSSKEGGNLVLGKMDKGQEEEYILYEDNELLASLEHKCGVKDSEIPYASEDLVHNSSRSPGDCVKLFIEVNNDVAANKGGTTNTVNFITGIYNQMATLYAAEQINTVLSEVFVWTTPSPYTATSADGLLTQFGQQKNGFNGDLAMLVGFSGSGGIAYVNGLCSFNSDFKMGYSGIGSTFSNVPTYSWSVNVLAHEFGHLFGSQHTHACVWNGNNTAIDGCGTPEGSCANPGLPAGGGTIMSYCHTKSVGINFALGFGSQPGSVMRSRVASATCLSACGTGGGSTPTCSDGIKNGTETGIDCGGSTCPPCQNTNCQQGTVTLVLDFYPNETSWNIKNSSNIIVASGSGYTQVNGTVNVPVCLPAGCYTFNITDAYGDGICCAYGNGSFKLLMGGQTLLSGGQFGASQTINFCVNNGTSTPSCTDGIKNGNETGIDCGGTCPACPTCTDGIKNGNETGIDCGGSCPACPTCTDGIKNGNETGVDCGGSCPACPTCNDGIKNGSETGIDCGGPSCVPCAVTSSCTDGIKNGNETGIDCGGSCPACPTCTDGIKNGSETGIDCGGPTCTPCSTPSCQQGSVALVLDFYPTETAWNIKNSSNVTLYSGSGYTQVNGAVNIPICLPVGCYTFNITDAYGDGMCCSYGNGSYKIIINGQTLITGGQFNASQTKNFCVTSSGGSTPTCTDGIKNGSETGIDCGGSTCPPCTATPTCNDGIKNGNETGIDCGGTCPACPSCNDGIKNGSETGIDCGGPSCPPCTAAPTCNDGIKNGNETGIDCGGTCPVCPSCNDGIKNGSETGIDCGGTCPACPTCTDGVKNGNETGIDCGGPSCVPCSSSTCQQGSVNLVLDFYPTETAWNIKNSSNAILYSGSGYTQVNGTANIPICLPVGCYTFNITDAYGDGMCCSYGNGSYKLVVNGQTLVTGGQFGASKTTSFCVTASGTSAPNCTDGIKNGNETGIDCGGSCPPCPTCNDGIKNGNETGIDCGGSCPACPTNGNGLIGGYYFETGNDGWTIGGMDAYRCTNCKASEGIGAMVIRDDSGVASSIISPMLPSLQNFNTMRIEFTFYAESVELTEDFFIEYSNDNGLTWNNITSLRSGTEFNNGSFISVTLNISTTFSNATRIRFRGDMGDDSDVIYLDAIKISGINNNANNFIEIHTLGANKVSESINIYPNPTSQIVNIDLTNRPVAREGKVEVRDIAGRLIKQDKFITEQSIHQLDLQSLNSGIYVIKLNLDGEISYHKILLER